MTRPTQASKLLYVFLLMLLWTVQAPLFPPSVEAARAVVQVAQAGGEEETVPTSPESNEAKEKATGFLDSITSFLDGVSSWIKEKATALTDRVDAVFGFEKGEGPLALFGTAFYIFIGIIFVFILAFVFNILRDMFAAMFARNKKPPPRRRR